MRLKKSDNLNGGPRIPESKVILNLSEWKALIKKSEKFLQLLDNLVDQNISLDKMAVQPSLRSYLHDMLATAEDLSDDILSLDVYVSGSKAEFEEYLKKYGPKEKLAANSTSMLDYIISTKIGSGIVDLHEVLEEKDRIAANLLLDVYHELQKLTMVDNNVIDALDRVLASIENIHSYEAHLHRNNLAKAANSLGLKTPVMF